MKHILTVTLPGNPTPIDFPVDKEVVSLGRAAVNDIKLRVEEVSTRHLEFRKSDDRLFVIDLGSTNGTTVNGLRVMEHELSSGDQLVIGETVEAIIRIVTDRAAEEIPAVAMAPKTLMGNSPSTTPTVMLQNTSNGDTPTALPAVAVARPITAPAIGAPAAVARPAASTVKARNPLGMSPAAIPAKPVAEEPAANEPVPLTPRKLTPPGVTPEPTPVAVQETAEKIAANASTKPKLVVQETDSQRPKLNMG